MDTENQPQSGPPNPEPQLPGYQPSTGRKLFMFLLCLVSLIGVWVYYFYAAK